MTLEPLCCPGCGAGVPLADEDRIPCPYCRTKVHVPHRYRELWVKHAAEARTRREAEARFAEVSRPPPRAVDWAAVALVLFLPALAAIAAVLVPVYSPPVVTIFAAFIVPALLPGAGIWIWSASIHATIVRFHLVLAGDPPERDGGPPRCRNCGAPLSLEADAISATCLYCGTDSLVTDIAAAARRIESALRQELRKLSDAVDVMRLRRRLLLGGAAAASVLLGALSLVVCWAYAAMW